MPRLAPGIPINMLVMPAGSVWFVNRVIGFRPLPTGGMSVTEVAPRLLSNSARVSDALVTVNGVAVPTFTVIGKSVVAGTLGLAGLPGVMIPGLALND